MQIRCSMPRCLLFLSTYALVQMLTSAASVICVEPLESSSPIHKTPLPTMAAIVFLVMKARRKSGSRCFWMLSLLLLDALANALTRVPGTLGLWIYIFNTGDLQRHASCSSNWDHSEQFCLFSPKSLLKAAIGQAFVPFSFELGLQKFFCIMTDQIKICWFLL